MTKREITSEIVKEYGFDVGGNRTSFLLKKDNIAQINLTYDYDSLNRMTALKKNGSTIASYSYDANGNQTKVTDDEYDTELTKLAENSTEKGVNEVSAGTKNLDEEFSENSSTASQDTAKAPNKNAKRNQARKSKKKQRQNKKKGRK